ncbi:MAG: hypothetical protein R3B49_10595 [Phycisphaerales bacterium]
MPPSETHPDQPRRADDARGNRRAGPPPGSTVDRRTGLDRRDIEHQDPRRGPADKPTSGLERRRGPGRRLSDFTKAAEEGEMTPEQFLFLVAIDEFKKANDKPYPTWTDVLEVVRLLGYRKTCAMELTLHRAEDWRERPDAPSNVRPDNWHTRPVNPMGKKSRLAGDPDEVDFDELERELDALEGIDDAA